jgi:hypothetical protein
VEETVLGGFFPTLSPSAARPATQRKGITEFGLPYEQEPAITRHLGWFLERHGMDVAANLGKERPVPDLILFNGGSLKPAVIQEQIRRAIGHWFGHPQGGGEADLPRILENPDPDLAVSIGAAYYGLVKIGRGVRVGSGSPRAYYLEVAPAEAAEPARAICLVERGQEEGTQTELGTHDFKVLANELVGFNIFSSSYRSGDRRGDLIPIDDSLTALAPLQTIIQYGKKSTKVQIPIRVVAEYTEVGTLALGCRSLSSDHRWQLQFQLRSAAAPVAVDDREVFDSALVAGACALASDAFLDSGAGPRLEGVVKAVATLVERPRHQWPLSFIRALADTLLKIPTVRRHSPLHEARWLNLLGYCMRPGLADGADPLRMKRIWRLHGQGPLHANRVQVRGEWWILWRRVAAGLTPGQQRQFVQELAPLLMPKKNPPRQIPTQERLELWMAVANMEQLNAKEKARWGRALLSELKPKKSKPQHFWALSRLGARELLYGPVDRVVAAPEVARWIDSLVQTQWRGRHPVTLALAQMARRTGDRTRDLTPDLLDRVRRWMVDDPRPKKGAAEQQQYLQEVVPMAGQKESQIFGEELPTGIVLHSRS